MIKCDYCGRENQDEKAPCSGCGTLPEGQAEPGRPVSVSGLLDCGVGVAAMAAGHVGGGVHVVRGLVKLALPGLPAGESSPRPWLERAAVMESLDIRQAITLYNQIALSYPGTTAAEEANRNVQTLRAAHPELEELPAASQKHLLP